MNTDNDNYDTSRGEQIALNVDGEQSRAAAAAPNRTFTSALMDTQVPICTREKKGWINELDSSVHFNRS